MNSVAVSWSPGLLSAAILALSSGPPGPSNSFALLTLFLRIWHQPPAPYPECDGENSPSPIIIFTTFLWRDRFVAACTRRGRVPVLDLCAGEFLVDACVDAGVPCWLGVSWGGCTLLDVVNGREEYLCRWLGLCLFLLGRCLGLVRRVWRLRGWMLRRTLWDVYVRSTFGDMGWIGRI